MPWPNAESQVLYKQTLLSPDLEESFLTGLAGQVQLAISVDLQFVYAAVVQLPRRLPLEFSKRVHSQYSFALRRSWLYAICIALL